VQRSRNVAEYDKWGVETIVTSCAGCLKMFKSYYIGQASLQPSALRTQDSGLRTQDFRVLHTLEWFAQLIGDGRLKPQKPLAKRVAYFDGCDIGRHSGVFEAPRQVLRSIPGVEQIEFPAHHESSRCCGGPLMASDPEMAASIASKRVREALDVGAEMVAVACPTCMVNLKDGANRLGAKIEIQDVTALLHRSLK
jgi:glycolate oxidase